MTMRKTTLTLSILLASTALTAAHAQEIAPAMAEAEEADTGPGEIIVTGTRATGQQAAESAAPIQLLSEAAISRVGQPNLNQALTQIVPSFTAQTQGTDMSNFSLSARLRGLSPNHTLVLVNGKRRHGSAILQVIAGPFQGSAAPSIDLIPPDAVQRVEIFQEGAAAVYGSDAVAGVINLILKSNTSGGSAKVTAGQYFDSEGELYSASGNLGFQVGDAGFISLTAFHRRNNYTFVGKGQTTITDLDGNLLPGRPAAWANLDLSNINGGQAKSYLTIGMINAGYDFGGVELYAFGNYAKRIGYAKQGYRHPARICAVSTGGNPGPYDPSTCFADTGIGGMVPLQSVRQEEYAMTVGLKGESDGWTYDLSTTYGSDYNDIYTLRSANRSLWIDTWNASGGKSAFTPSSFYNGAFKLTQWTNTLDISKEVEVGFAEPLTIAFGGEYREDEYAILKGDEASTYKEGGQSFPGYTASDAGSYARKSKAVYLNLIAKPVDDWTVDLAGRYEHFSDFGDTVIGKLTTRYDFSPAFALRGTASTGFRAPTLQEGNYSATNVAPTSATVQLPPNSPSAALLGFAPLKPEKSTNFSVGTVLRPIDRLVVTIDGYYIKIKDRIAGTANIFGIRSGAVVNQAVLDAIALRGTAIDAVPTVSAATFTNGIDTRTLGIDFSSRYPVEFDFGQLDLSFNANWTKTKVTKNKIPALFDVRSEAFIETSNPKYKLVFGALFTSGGFTANLRQVFYGASSILVNPDRAAFGGPYKAVVGATGITDLELAYDITEWANFAVGANNLLNKKPPKPKLVTDFVNVTVPVGISPYVNNTTTIGAPYNHGPYGTNGGYYYARLSLKF